MWFLAIPLGLLFGAALARRTTLRAGRSYRIALQVAPPAGAASSALATALFQQLTSTGARDILISGTEPIIAIYTQPAIATDRSVQIGQPYPLTLDGVRCTATLLEAKEVP